MRAAAFRPIHPGLAAVLTGSSALVLAGPAVPAPVRAPLVVLYLLLAPGYAVLPSWGRGSRVLHFLLAVTLGSTLAVALGTVMSENGWWRVDVAVTVTVALVVVTTLGRVWRDRAALAAMFAGGAR